MPQHREALCWGTTVQRGQCRDDIALFCMRIWVLHALGVTHKATLHQHGVKYHQKGVALYSLGP